MGFMCSSENGHPILDLNHLTLILFLIVVFGKANFEKSQQKTTKA